MSSRPLFTSLAFPLLSNSSGSSGTCFPAFWNSQYRLHVFPGSAPIPIFSIAYLFLVWVIGLALFGLSYSPCCFFLVTRWLLSGWFIRWTINRGSVAKQREISAASREEFKNATITGDFGSVRKTRTNKNSLSYLDNLWEECKTSERACVTCQRGWTEQLVTRMLV